MDNKKRLWKYLYAQAHPQADFSQDILNASNNLTSTLNSHSALNDAFNNMPDVDPAETMNAFIKGTKRDTQLSALQGLQKFQDDQGYWYHNPELPTFSSSEDSLDIGFPNEDLNFQTGVSDVAAELSKSYSENSDMMPLGNMNTHLDLLKLFDLLLKKK